MRTKRRRRGNPRAGQTIGIATRFQPGVSGNPGGRPKTRVLTEMLAAIGNETEPKSGKSFFQLAAEALLGQAFNGNVQAFREFADRVEGKATQHVELTGAGGRPIAIAPSRADDWAREYETASLERRLEMSIELDDKILAAAEEIKSKRAMPVTDDMRYRAWIREFSRLTASGMSHADAKAKLPPLAQMPVN